MGLRAEILVNSGLIYLFIIMCIIYLELCPQAPSFVCLDQPKINVRSSTPMTLKRVDVVQVTSLLS